MSNKSKSNLTMDRSDVVNYAILGISSMFKSTRCVVTGDASLVLNRKLESVQWIDIAMDIKDASTAKLGDLNFSLAESCCGIRVKLVSQEELRSYDVAIIDGVTCLAAS